MSKACIKLKGVKGQIILHSNLSRGHEAMRELLTAFIASQKSKSTRVLAAKLIKTNQFKAADAIDEDANYHYDIYPLSKRICVYSVNSDGTRFLAEITKSDNDNNTQ